LSGRLLQKCGRSQPPAEISCKNTDAFGPQWKALAKLPMASARSGRLLQSYRRLRPAAEGSRKVADGFGSQRKVFKPTFETKTIPIKNIFKKKERLKKRSW